VEREGTTALLERKMVEVVELTREKLSLLETKGGEGGWIDKRKAFFVEDEGCEGGGLTGFAAKQGE